MAGSGRSRFWLGLGLVVLATTCGVLLYSTWVNRMVSVDFQKTASSGEFNEALSTIQRSGKGNGTEAVFNGDSVKLICNLMPGQGDGTDPRFLNVGNTPAMVYKGASGAYYILGTVRVLTYDAENSQWLGGDTVTNRKYIYVPVRIVKYHI